MQLSEITSSSSTPSATVSRIIQAALAIVLGAFIIGMVGFSTIDIVHNAAHDVRHSNGFPCH
jgi:cobalt transporter subunit CbtB